MLSDYIGIATRAQIEKILDKQEILYSGCKYYGFDNKVAGVMLTIYLLTDELKLQFDKDDILSAVLDY